MEQYYWWEFLVEQFRIMSSLESNVRSYCRSLPETFHKAEGALVFSTSGRCYIDFLSGCGALNYGHNHPDLQEVLLSYITNHGIAISLDMETQSKNEFMAAFYEHILKPRGLDYKLQFPGPTGANAVEGAIKLARKITERSNIIAFTNAFHGCSLGALALTGNQHHRNSSEALLTNVMRAPYDGYWGAEVDTSFQLSELLSDPSSGYDFPAAIIVELIQGEGGLNFASLEWIQNIAKLAKEHGILLIVDDIQAGCGRSGDFFSFESLGIYPDIVCLAKSVSGFGLPMSLVLLKPEYDIWEPGEHNGTFRGNNLAFVTATAAIKRFWRDDVFRNGIYDRIAKKSALLHDLVQIYPDFLDIKGRGLMTGLAFSDPKLAKSVQQDCFGQGLIIELCGPHNEVLKLLPPLNISDEALSQGLDIITTAVHDTMNDMNPVPSEVAYA